MAYALLIVMAAATLPSPLYGLYRIWDHLSALMITVVFAIFAGGAIAAQRADGLVAARLGRRGVMLSSVATMMISAGLLAAWKALPGLLIGRFVTGLAVGLASGTAITLANGSHAISLSIHGRQLVSTPGGRRAGSCRP